MAFAWYVAQTKPNAERIAVRRLNEQSFTTYLPLLTSRHAKNGRVTERKTPLFRGYLFISLDLLDDYWKRVNSTYAVLALLPRSDNPVSIAGRHVESLRTAELNGYFRAGAILPGDRVQVFRGTLAGQVLECIDGGGGSRIKCLWSCLGAMRVVSVPIVDVTVMR